MMAKCGRYVWLAAMVWAACCAGELLGGASRGAGRRMIQAGKRREYKKKGYTIEWARAGKARAHIVIGAKAPAPVRFAARELKAYLDRITGASFRVVHAIPADGRAIVLGDGDGARKAGIDVKTIARDGYAIRCVGQTLYVAGVDDTTAKSDVLDTLVGKQLHERLPRAKLAAALDPGTWNFERGTLHGVYRLLEELGVRWFFPGPKGEAVPKRPDLTVQAFDLLEEPAYVLRHIGSARWCLATVRREKFPHVDPNEYKTLGWTGRVNRLWRLRVRDSSAWFAFNHRPPRTRWKYRFGKSHPEYFALRADGRREVDMPGRYRWHLCYTHPGVLTETLLDVEAYFAGKPSTARGLPASGKGRGNRGWQISACYGDSVSMLPHDSFRPCQCPNCKALQRPKAPRWARNSGLVWPFVAKVAKHVEQKFPDKLVFCLAYSSFTTVPEGMTSLPNNVVVGLCPHGAKKLNKTYNLTQPEARARYMELAKQWHRMNKLPMLCWFHHLYSYATRRCGVPMLIPHTLGTLARDLAPYVRLWFMEFDPDAIVLEHINRYVIHRVLWNPNESVDAILDDYCQHYYGPAAKVVREVLADVESRSQRLGPTGVGRVAIWEDFFPEATIKTYRQAADRAIVLTKGTPHADAAQVFSTWFVGVIEKGYRRYVSEVRDMRLSKAATWPVRKAAGPIRIDGKLAEPAWGKPATGRFHNNADGKPPKWTTTLHLAYDATNLYVGFVCHDPKAQARPTVRGMADYIEVFLDPDNDRRDYYWWLVSIGGDLDDVHFRGARGGPNPKWTSGATAVVTRAADRWVLEMAIPLKRMRGAAGKLARRHWTANFCRTIFSPPRPTDRYISTSPMMRGRFHQPSLFGRVAFED